jgi:hypothetical protein
MGTGIGKHCQRCADQLNYDDGFNSAKTLCEKCDSIVRFDQLSDEEKEDILRGK